MWPIPAPPTPSAAPSPRSDAPPPARSFREAKQATCAPQLAAPEGAEAGPKPADAPARASPTESAAPPPGGQSPPPCGAAAPHLRAPDPPSRPAAATAAPRRSATPPPPSGGLTFREYRERHGLGHLAGAALLRHLEGRGPPSAVCYAETRPWPSAAPARRLRLRHPPHRTHLHT
jgi:hypothetical protein